jgi:drug/metabolite transporter (DMT)-like permease
MMAALLAFASALSFGASDFAGGRAARRAPVLSVTLLSQIAGLAILVPALLVLPGALTSTALMTGAAAGLAGALGLVVYLRALAIGPMGVASPLAGVVGAVIPVVVGIGLGERPAPLAVVGIVLGVVTIGMTSWTVGTGRHVQDLAGPGLALLGGFGFGLFFVGLDATPVDSGLWPLVGARIASVVIVSVLLAARRRRVVGSSAWGLIVVTGTLDMAANVLFLLATRSGLLSLAAVIASLYPAVTAVLAHRVLGERLETRQRLGVVVCILAVALIAAS